MAARTHVVDSGGTSRLVKNNRLFVVDTGGVSRSVQKLWVVDSGGVSRLVYQGLQVSISDTSVSSTKVGGSAFCGFQLDTDGTIDLGQSASVQDNYGTDGGPWRISGASADYEVRFTKTSGVNPNSALSSALSPTWHNLGTNRQLGYYIAAPSGTMDGTFTVEIRRVSDLVVLDTMTLTMSCESTV